MIYGLYICRWTVLSQGMDTDVQTFILFFSLSLNASFQPSDSFFSLCFFPQEYLQTQMMTLKEKREDLMKYKLDGEKESLKWLVGIHCYYPAGI